MKMLTYAAIAASLIGLPATAASVLVGSSDGTIATVDTATGVVSNSFDTGSQSWFDIAVNNAGLGYGVSNGSSLYSINTILQTASLIGSTLANINGLAFGSGGALYGTGGSACIR